MEDYSSEDDWEQGFEENQEEDEEVKVEKEEEDDDDEGNKRDWKDLPIELLSQILTFLYLDDVKRFHKVCKNWNSIKDPKEHCPLKCPIISSQWLVHKDTYDGEVCKFFHPFYKDRYCIDIPELMSAVLLHSNNGWLLMSLGSKTLFFINPFTKERVNLPDSSSNVLKWKSVIFSSEPSAPNCKVIGVEAYFDHYCHLYIISRDESSWNEHKIEDYDPPMFHSECHPVFYNDKLYFLGKNGEMGVFDPIEEKWTTHKVSNAPPEELTYESYLVECNGQLMAVFLAYMGTNISVQTLDEKKMEWKNVDNLGDFMLFISVLTSFAIEKGIDRMENKIYFPRLYGDYSVFYCLATQSYKTFGNRFNHNDLFWTREQLNCCWTQPSAHPTRYPEDLEWFLDEDFGSSTGSEQSESDKET